MPPRTSRTPRQAGSLTPLPDGAPVPSPRDQAPAAGGISGPAGQGTPVRPGRRPASSAPAGGATVDGVPPAGSRTYTIALPAGLELLNANDRGHWTRRRRITAALREAAAWLARQQHIPMLGCVRIDAVYEPPDRRRRDVPNLYPSFKACVDGLVDAGVLLDDSDRYVRGFEMSSGERCPRGRLVLHVTEVGP